MATLLLAMPTTLANGAVLLLGGGAGRASSSIGGRASSAVDCMLVLAIRGDEKLSRQLKELDNAKTLLPSRRETMRNGSLTVGRF